MPPPAPHWHTLTPRQRATLFDREWDASHRATATRPRPTLTQLAALAAWGRAHGPRIPR